MVERKQATDAEISTVIEAVNTAIQDRLKKHGRGKWVSAHEGLGITVEEVHELTMAVHKNNHEEIREELLDIAVCGIWGYLSMLDV